MGPSCRYAIILLPGAPPLRVLPGIERKFRIDAAAGRH